MEKNKQIASLLENHLKKFGWLAYYYIGPAWSKQDITEILENNLKIIKDPVLKIKEIRAYKKEIEQKKKKLQKRLRLDNNVISLLNKIGVMIFLKGYRKEFLIYSNYCFEPILKEISNRLCFSLEQTRFITKDEIRIYLTDPRKLTRKMRNNIETRFSEGCISVVESDAVSIIRIGDSKKYSKFIKPEIETVTKVIKGNCAYAGRVTGIARIINSRNEIGKIKKGEILVSRATNPDLIIAMQRAAAIVTDEGGITSHAAIVSREMKKPCVIGTKIATKIILDGDMLEIDAGKGEVIKVEK